LFRNKDRKIIYIGKAKDIKNRVSSYLQRAINPKVEALIKEVESIDYIISSSEIEAFLLEAKLIKKHKPFYNTKLADSKFFPYVEISKGENPYVLVTRKKINKDSSYFGPYPDVKILKNVMRFIRRIFPYQSIRNHPKRVCLYHHLNLCPCVPVFGNIREYEKNLSRIKKILSGQSAGLIKQMERERDRLAKAEEFEKAGLVQKQIEGLKLITNPAFDIAIYERDPLFYWRKSENEINELRKILSPFFQISKLVRIECFDISNIAGRIATGSMVVFLNGIESKKDYRRFRIKNEGIPNDFAMMQEVIKRRLKHSEWEYPDLLVVDGGKGQLSAAQSALQELGIDIPAMQIFLK